MFPVIIPMNTNVNYHALFSQRIKTTHGNLLRWGMVTVLFTLALTFVAGAIGFIVTLLNQGATWTELLMLGGLMSLVSLCGAIYTSALGTAAAYMSRSRLKARHWDIHTTWGNALRWFAVLVAIAVTLLLGYGIASVAGSLMHELSRYRIDGFMVMVSAVATESPRRRYHACGMVHRRARFR